MSDKKLLEESTIRRFQTLANIKSIDVLGEGKKSGSKHEKGESAAEEKAEHGKGHKSEKGEKKLKEAEEAKPAGGRKTSSAMRPEDSAKRAAGKELEEALEEETVEEMFMGEAEGEEAAGGDMGDMGGGEESGGEGGDDVKPEVEALVSALNGLLAKVGKGELEVDVDAGAEGGEGEAGGEEAPVMEAKKKKEEKKKKPAEKEEESVYESLNLEVEDDEALAEELTRRVAARLVAEMKKAKKPKGMTEDFLGGGTKKATPPKGHGAGGKSFGTKSKGR